jgi:hypothetical protein
MRILTFPAFGSAILEKASLERLIVELYFGQVSTTLTITLEDVDGFRARFVAPVHFTQSNLPQK